MQTNCILIASNFASRSPYWLQIEFFNSLLFYFIFATNLSQQKVVASQQMSLPSLNNQRGMKRREQDFDTWNQYEERLAILNTENIKICGWTTKLEAMKMQYVCISAMSAEYLQKIWLFNSPR